MTDYIYTPETEILLHRSISPLILVDTSDDAAIAEMVAQGVEIQNQITRLCKGETNLWELLEALEAFAPDNDQWFDEIADNLEDELGRYGTPENYIENGSQW